MSKRKKTKRKPKKRAIKKPVIVASIGEWQVQRDARGKYRLTTTKIGGYVLDLKDLPQVAGMIEKAYHREVQPRKGRIFA